MNTGKIPVTNFSRGRPGRSPRFFQPVCRDRSQLCPTPFGLCSTGPNGIFPLALRRPPTDDIPIRSIRRLIVPAASGKITFEGNRARFAILACLAAQPYQRVRYVHISPF